VTPGNVNNRSVNNALPEPTSTDNPAVPDTENGNRVALRRAPATGAGFTAAEAGTATATNPADTNADTARPTLNFRTCFIDRTRTVVSPQLGPEGVEHTGAGT